MIKLQSTIIYQPGTIARIKKTNKFGLVMSLFAETRVTYVYNILPLNTSKWKFIRIIQLCFIKGLLK